jgi:hypothetical protein
LIDHYMLKWLRCAELSRQFVETTSSCGIQHARYFSVGQAVPLAGPASPSSFQEAKADLPV